MPAPLNTVVVSVLSLFCALTIAVYSAAEINIPVQRFLPNGVGIALGLLCLALILRFRDGFRRGLPVFLAIALLLLALPLFLESFNGVNRWLYLGPVSLQISAVVLPLLLYHSHRVGAEFPLFAVLPLIVASWLLFLQPDAGQSLALALASLPVLSRFKSQRTLMALGLLLAVPSVWVWRQEDPLFPVPEVEGVLYLILEIPKLGWPLCALAVTALLWPLVRTGLQRPLVQSFVLLIFGGIISATAGPLVNKVFPVPVLGAGISYVLGYFLMLALALLDEEQEQKIEVSRA